MNDERLFFALLFLSCAIGTAAGVLFAQWVMS